MISDILTILLTGITAIGDFLLMVVNFILFDVLLTWHTVTAMVASSFGFILACMLSTAGRYNNEYEELLTGALRDTENQLKVKESNNERLINNMQKAFELEKDKLIRDHNRNIRDLMTGHNQRIEDMTKAHEELVTSLNKRINVLLEDNNNFVVEMEKRRFEVEKFQIDNDGWKKDISNLKKRHATEVASLKGAIIREVDRANDLEKKLELMKMDLQKAQLDLREAELKNELEPYKKWTTRESKYSKPFATIDTEAYENQRV
jgi:hypothetical protein